MASVRPLRIGLCFTLPNGLNHGNEKKTPFGTPEDHRRKNVLGRDMAVSENRGTPKSSILIGFSTINHPFWGAFIFGPFFPAKDYVSILYYFQISEPADWALKGHEMDRFQGTFSTLSDDINGSHLQVDPINGLIVMQPTSRTGRTHQHLPAYHHSRVFPYSGCLYSLYLHGKRNITQTIHVMALITVFSLKPAESPGRGAAFASTSANRRGRKQSPEPFGNHW